MKIGEYLGMTVVVMEEKKDWWKCYFIDEKRTYNLWHKQVKILHEIPDEVVNALADPV